MKKTVQIEKKQRLFIAPYSSMTKAFKKFLDENFEYEFLGYLDASKSGDDIYKVDAIGEIVYDIIYIVSPNYAPEIFKEYRSKNIPKKKIKFATFEDGFVETSLFMQSVQNRTTQILLKSQKFLFTHLKKYLEDKNFVLFFAPGFVDLNIKELYSYFDQHSSYKIAIISDDAAQINKLKDANFKIVSSNSLLGLYYALRSKVKILDHNPTTKKYTQFLINSKCVQIWHGIPLKKIGHLANYKQIEYDIVVSTSDFVSEYAFANLFSYKKIINSGYPRNDVFFTSKAAPKSLALLDNDIYDFLKNTKKKIFIYMPTWRPDTEIPNPLELTKLNTFAKEQDILIIIKTHPFTREESFYDATLDMSKFKYTKNYEQNLLFYPTTDDIYPIFALSHTLITDYSSVYFDYLLLNKPIIFFLYDKEHYIKSHGDFMLDFEAYTPGEKAYTTVALKEAIKESIFKDTHKRAREELKNRLFEIQDGASSKILLDEIGKLS